MKQDNKVEPVQQYELFCGAEEKGCDCICKKNEPFKSNECYYYSGDKETGHRIYDKKQLPEQTKVEPVAVEYKGKDEAIRQMEQGVKFLALELPELAFIDIKDRWETVKEFISQSLPAVPIVEDKELINVYDEYIQLLTDELNDLVSMAAVHGWKSKRFEKGEELRNKITQLKSQSLPVVPIVDDKNLPNEIVTKYWDYATSQAEERYSHNVEFGSHYREGIFIGIYHILSQSLPVEEDEDELWNDIISTARWHNGTWEKNRQDRMVEHFKHLFSIQRKNIKQ